MTGCGDVEDITTNGGQLALETDCSFPCSGDPIQLCGGAERLSLYEWDGVLNDWHTPENTGHYEVNSLSIPVYRLDNAKLYSQLLIGGIVIPLLSNVGINGKVQFLEKFGTSDPPNSTGKHDLKFKK